MARTVLTALRVAVVAAFAAGSTALTGAPTALAGAGAASVPATAPTTLLTGQLVRVERSHLASPAVLAARQHAASLAALGAAAGAAPREDPAEADTDTDTDADTDASALLDVGGTSVPLDPAAVAGIATGDRLTVRVAVPSPVRAAVAAGTAVPTGPLRTRAVRVAAAALAAAAQAPAAAGSPLAAVTAAWASASGAPLAATVQGVSAAAPGAPSTTPATAPRLLAASTAPGTTASASPVVHRVRVAVVAYRGLANPTSDAQVQALVASTSAFWSQQTGGRVAFAVSGPVVRYATTASCTTPSALWDEAAARTGWTRGPDAHLLVVLPDAAYTQAGCALGLGELSAGLDAGGRVYTSSTTTSALAHEIGHNLSLGHASRLWCGATSEPTTPAAAPSGSSSSTASSSSCTSEEYGDMPDVMGYATTLPQIGNLSAAALGRLGLLGAGQLAVTAPGVTTVVLAPLSATSGVRSVVVTDPRSAVRYYLEDRQRTGNDAAGWGAWGQRAGTAYGLRVQRVTADGRTQLLDPTPHAVGTVDTDVVVAPGTTFADAGDGVEVRAVQGADGSVTARVSLAAAGRAHWGTTASSPSPTGSAGATGAPAPAVLAVSTAATGPTGGPAQVVVTVRVTRTGTTGAPAPSGTGSPTGVVTVSEAGAALRSGPLVGGAVSLALPSPAVGPHVLGISYGGDATTAPAAVTSALVVPAVAPRR